MTDIRNITYTTRDFSKPDLKGTEETQSLSARVDLKTSKYLLHRVLVGQNENMRQGSASTKTRSEVTGGGRKPWKQKGTGRARSGSSTSPLWKGGGVTFGPKPRIYKKKTNLKERRLALNTALYLASERVTVIKNFGLGSNLVKTKEFLKLLLKFTPDFLSKKVLLILPNSTEGVPLYSRNLKNLTIASKATLALSDILTADSILIVAEALPKLVIS